MKAIKVFCEECYVTTYPAINNHHPSYESIMCSGCGWVIYCDEENMVNIEETMNISDLVNRVGD